MLYYLVKYSSKIGFRVFFRKIYFHNEGKVPKGKTVIFAVNHPTAFIDPVIVPSLMGPIVHFVVRGDIFVGKFVLMILRSLKMYPIFRFRDGFSEIRRNQELMDGLQKMLADGKHILILAEGQTKHEKRLRPVQKGTARLAFDTIEKHGTSDLAVMPVGVNYTDSDQFRSRVMIEFGEPLILSDYDDVRAENPRKAVKRLTDDLQRELRKLVIHVEDEADDKLANGLLDIQRNDRRETIFPLLTPTNELWRQEYHWVESLNARSNEEKEQLKMLHDSYETILQSRGVDDLGVARADTYRPTNSLFILLGWPLYAIGYLLNVLPLAMAKRLADQKVKKIEFHSSVRYGAGLVGYLFYWLILMVVAAIIGTKWAWLAWLSIPFLGFYALLYRDFLLEWQAAARFARLTPNEKNDIFEARKAMKSAL